MSPSSPGAGDLLQLLDPGVVDEQVADHQDAVRPRVPRARPPPRRSPCRRAASRRSSACPRRARAGRAGRGWRPGWRARSRPARRRRAGRRARVVKRARRERGLEALVALHALVAAPGELAAADGGEVASEVGAPVAEADDADADHAAILSRASTTRAPAWPSPYSGGRSGGGVRSSAARARVERRGPPACSSPLRPSRAIPWCRAASRTARRRGTPPSGRRPSRSGRRARRSAAP